MTYFSRFMINPQRRGAWKLLRSPQAMHAAVMATLPPDTDYSESRILWRLDEFQHAPVLYMLSPEEPDFSALVEQAGWHNRSLWSFAGEAGERSGVGFPPCREPGEASYESADG